MLKSPARRLLGSERRAKQQEMFSILNAIIRRAHCVYSIPKIVYEFVKV